MAIYMISDGDGNALTDGVQWHEARQMAQRIANNRGESVWLSESGNPDDEGEEFKPTIGQAPMEFD